MSANEDEAPAAVDEPATDDVTAQAPAPSPTPTATQPEPTTPPTPATEPGTTTEPWVDPFPPDPDPSYSVHGNTPGPEFEGF